MHRASPRFRALRLGAGAVVCLGAATAAVALASGVPAGGAPGVSVRHAGSSRPDELSIVLKSKVLFPLGTAIAESSPNIATLDSDGPSIVVGSKLNGCVYALHLSNLSTVPGWPKCLDAGIDSTPSVLAGSSGLDTVYVTTGDTPGQVPPVFNENCSGDLPACNGALYSLKPGAGVNWERALPDLISPKDFGSHPPIVASPTVGDTGDGTQSIVVGCICLSLYRLDADTGATEAGWPQHTADTTFSTAAIGPVDYQQRIIAASDSTAGPGAINNWDGGSVRSMNANGGTNWTAASNEVVTSSPAVGDLTGAAGATVVAYGHGSYWYGVKGGGYATDADGLTVDNASTGAKEWEAHLGGFTRASPALADLTGNGQLDVVEPTWYSLNSPNRTGGAVFAYSPSGTELWGDKTLGQSTVIAGGVATADFGEGYQDVVVGTGLGWGILDGRTGDVVAPVQGLNVNWDGHPANLGVLDTPLVTPDPSGSGLDVVIAGTYGGGSSDGTKGFVAVYQVVGSPHTVGTGAWPMFHHDPQLSGSADAATPNVVGMAATPDAKGYWIVADDGTVYNLGDAGFYGDMAGRSLNEPVVGMAATPDGKGYWLVAADGGIFSFGDATFYGSTGNIHLQKPIVGMTATRDGKGYWFVASDGGVFSFGDAVFHGSMGGKKLNKPVVGMAADLVTGGYWLVAADGGIFSFDAPFYGSTGNLHLQKPIVGMEAPANAAGYRFVAADGGVFCFDQPFHGSTGNLHLVLPVVGMAANNVTTGYWLVAADGGLFSFDTTYYGRG